ncbi:potassium-transporting ATPase KdpC subunit [Halomonas cupida]|uniref:Potassium-transporting ATPase KdpC subunit n=1 Tax=Halomonas cupida TaxID=44933 RepID=A0A1M7IMM0_9GAMM|nr:potassium-transporting ATPase subunit KdpC [Halomonas cupida]GEN24120.1 potassium-transporting ATPase KdpC subunit [Halomonas cupida]SHM41951.1 K+-transporting ATPase ATPase C chain [Halomonas cupida]
MTVSMTTRASLLTSLRMMVLLAALLGLLYPFVVTSLSEVVFPSQSRGSLVYDENGTIVGSALVGQPFVGAEYFHGRPSAANYAPDQVSGSNLSPGNATLRERALQEARAIEERDGVTIGEIPVDLLAASGSGIDPHISPQAALIQVPRVSRERNMPITEVKNAISSATENGGIVGQPAVNVLKLNLALDEQARGMP